MVNRFKSSNSKNISFNFSKHRKNSHIRNTKHIPKFLFSNKQKKCNFASFQIGGKVYKCGTSKEEDAWLTKLGVKTRQQVIFGYYGKVLIVDGIDYSRHMVYEYLGSFVHSIRAYPRERWDIPTWMGKTPREMYNETVNRFKFLHANSWKVFFVWDYEFKKGLLGRLYRGGDDNLY